jgi:hypothetical protein
MRQRMRVRIGVLALVGMGLTACTSVEISRSAPAQSVAPPPEAFTHRLATPEVALYWNCTRPEAGVLHFDGIAKNIAGREVRSLALRLTSVDANNLLLEAAALPTIILHSDKFSPVHLQLLIRGTEARFDLSYEYPLAPPVDLPTPRAATTEQFTATDVCARTRYRAR